MSSGPPSIRSKKSWGSTPRAWARARTSPAAAVAASTQLLATSFSRLALPAPPSVPVHTVFAPTAAKTGSTVSRPSSGPAASTVSRPSSAGRRVPRTGAS